MREEEGKAVTELVTCANMVQPTQALQLPNFSFSCSLACSHTHIHTHSPTLMHFYCLHLLFFLPSSTSSLSLSAALPPLWHSHPSSALLHLFHLPSHFLLLCPFLTSAFSYFNLLAASHTDAYVCTLVSETLFQRQRDLILSSAPFIAKALSFCQKKNYKGTLLYGCKIPPH